MFRIFLPTVLAKIQCQLKWRKILPSAFRACSTFYTLWIEKKILCPTGQTVWEKKQDREKCAHVLVAYVWRACQRQCVAPVRGWGSAQWSTAVPSNCVLPHCHPGTMMLTVIGDCVLRSSLLHYIPPIPCSCAPLLSGPTCSPWLLMQSWAHH